MEWKEVSTRIDNEIKIGTKIPKTSGGTRTVTRKTEDRIYVRTGVKTKAEKYTTKDMLQYAFNTIESGQEFTSTDLKSNFPKEYSQGSCVFSMTGGILVLLDEAKCIRNGRRTEYVNNINNERRGHLHDRI